MPEFFSFTQSNIRNISPEITYHPGKNSPSTAVFSILIPTWNNLPYLKTCVESIRKNSTFPHQIVLHVNEGSDGTLDWAVAEGLDFSHSRHNSGVCFALNAAASLATCDHIAFFNDDMYALPDWDQMLVNEIRLLSDEALNQPYYFLSATMIEPRDTGNACVIAPQDFGQNLADFRENDLLTQFRDFKMEDWSGATWPPNVLPRKLWDLVGGYSIEFSPGMSSDPDFSMKLWQAGVRYFKGVGSSRVYHFQAKSTGRIVKNDGNAQFLKKWGISQSTFFKHYLRRGQKWAGILPDPVASASLWLERMKGKMKTRFG